MLIALLNGSLIYKQDSLEDPHHPGYMEDGSIAVCRCFVVLSRNDST